MRWGKKSVVDLQFGPGDLSGFTSAGMAGFHDLNPAAVVRELLQNSLDAAREAKRGKSIVRFEIAHHHTAQVPGIKAYQSAFEQAERGQRELSDGNLPDQAVGIVDAIRGCLGSAECETLFVLDNGIGLDRNRMRSLLSDGHSHKSVEGTGAVGNGHLVVIPASDLRYVLYGGRTENGVMIGAGHAVLASHEENRKRRSKDGFYVELLRHDDFFEPFVFPQNERIPDYIRSKLDWISSNWEPGAGSVVAVPGFNHFRRSRESLWDVVSKAAACNFFAVFAEGKLRLEVVEGDRTDILDQSNIEAILTKFAGEKRSRSKFLSGSRAWSAFETMRTGREIMVNTEIGKIPVRLLETSEGRTRIDLCRNGMWVTDDLPKLQGHRFTDLKPFHGVVLLEADAGEIHRIVRKAEGPLHNSLTRKWLSRDEKQKLEAAMEVVFSEIKKRVPKYENEQFQITDVLPITSYGFSSGGRRPGLVGQFKEVKKPPRLQTMSDTEDTEVGPGAGDRENDGNRKGVNNNRRGRGTFRRSGNAIRFAALSIPMNKRSYRIDLTPTERTPGSEVRFALDESLDETCDLFGSETFVELSAVKVDGQPVPERRLTCDEEGRVLGIRLGVVHPEKTLRIEFDYEVPEDIDMVDDMPVVLKTQLIRRAADVKQQGAS